MQRWIRSISKLAWFPNLRLVGVVSAPLGDSLTNDRDSFGLVLFHHCYSCAYPLMHYHDAAALSILNLAPTPINPRSTMV